MRVHYVRLATNCCLVRVIARESQDRDLPQKASEFLPAFQKALPVNVSLDSVDPI